MAFQLVEYGELNGFTISEEDGHGVVLAISESDEKEEVDSGRKETGAETSGTGAETPKKEPIAAEQKGGGHETDAEIEQEHAKMQAEGANKCAVEAETKAEAAEGVAVAAISNESPAELPDPSKEPVGLDGLVSQN